MGTSRAMEERPTTARRPGRRPGHDRHLSDLWKARGLERYGATRTVLHAVLGLTGFVLMVFAPPPRFALAAQIVAAAASILAVTFWAAASRRPRGGAYFAHATLAIGTLGIGLAASAYKSPAEEVAILTMLLWGTLYVFLALSRRSALVHAASRLTVVIAVLLYDSRGAHGHLDTPFVATALVIGMLVCAGIGDRASQEIHRSALVDPLTGCPNRQALELMLRHECALALRTEEPFCVAIIDLDHFKEVNDTRGHAAGDRLLVEVATVWQEMMRGGDVISRLAGDEFAVVLSRCSSAEAERVLTRLIEGSGHGCSIGLAESVGHDSVDELLRRADDALYAAKAAGRGQVHLLRATPGRSGKLQGAGASSDLDDAVR